LKTSKSPIILIILIVAMMAAGCSEKQAKRSDSRKDELIVAVGSEPEAGFDPTTGWGRYGSPLFQSTLLKRDHDMNIVYDLAETYEVSGDGLIWKVKLRRDVKFSDGVPLTAADVQYTFETAGASGSAIDLSFMQSVEVPNAYTVKFVLKEPRSTFVQTLVETGIVPRHAHGENYADNPIGSGPYRLVQWDKGQQLIVEPNPEYYGPKSRFNKLVFLFLSEDAAFAAAKAGELDVAAIPAAFSYQPVPGMRIEAVRSVDNRGISFPYVKSGGKTADGYPIGNDVTADRAIRAAINIALDRQALVDGVLEGYGTPAFTLNDGLPWFNPEAVIPDADPEAAKRLLADDGWLDADGDGILEKDGLKAVFTLLYPSGDLTRQSLAIATADFIKPLGIRINVEGKSWDELGKRMHANAVMFGWGSHDPMEMYNVYSGKLGGADYFNPGYYSNPAVENVMAQALRATKEEEANALWQKAQWDGTTGLSARGDAPWAWLVNLDHLYLVREGLSIGRQKIHPHGHGWPVTDNIEEWQWND